MMTKLVIVEEVTRILKRDGCVKASVLVSEATPKKAPLHDEFEWNDKVAAHEHRLDQARKIIRTTKVVYEGEESRMVHVPVIISADYEGSKEGEYKPIAMIICDKDQFELALGQIRSQMNSLIEAFNELMDAFTNRKDEAA